MRVLGLVLAAAVFAGAAGAQQRKGRFDPAQFLERQVEEATKVYKLDDSQKEKLKTLLEARGKASREKMEPIRKAFEDAKKEGKRLNREEFQEKFGDIFANMRKDREETATMVRDQILNDEQKKTFDERKTKGESLLGGQGFGRGGAGQPGQGGFGRGGTTQQETVWDRWLGQVVEKGKLTDEQKSKATVMLGQAKEAAAAYRKDKDADFKKAADELSKAREAGREAIAAALKTTEELNKPIVEIGNKWKADILGLLNEDQKKLVESIPFGGTGGRTRRPQNNN